jgi:HD-like signal output (HDOD) protein
VADVVPQLDELAELVEQLPAHDPVALRVLQVANDERADAGALGEAVEADPALTARLLRLANSTYYGMSGRIGNASAAVRVVGFTTVRSLAATVAAGLNGGGALPPGYWDHAALAASSCALVAGRAGVPRNDAFSLGLLHDLGRAVLVRSDTLAHVPLELHPALAAALLRVWSFPPALCDAIAVHHDPAAASAPHQRALVAALAVARAVNAELDPVSDDEQRAGLAVLGITEDELVGLVDHASATAGAVAAAFS